MSLNETKLLGVRGKEDISTQWLTLMEHARQPEALPHAGCTALIVASTISIRPPKIDTKKGTGTCQKPPPPPLFRRSSVPPAPRAQQFLSPLIPLKLLIACLLLS